MNHKSLAKKYEMFDGAVVIWLMPVITVYHQMVIDIAKTAFGFSENDENWREGLNAAQVIFIRIEGSVVDVEFNITDADDYDVNSLKLYWTNRKQGDIKHNWQLFSVALTYQTILVLQDAYIATRRQDIPKFEPGVLAEPTPADNPKTDDEKKKVKRTGKRTVKE